LRALSIPTKTKRLANASASEYLRRCRVRSEEIMGSWWLDKRFISIRKGNDRYWSE